MNRSGLRDNPRRLIVNADDFGLSPGINAGIIAAHRDGIVTSTSLMVRWPAAEQAVEFARQCPRLSLGLHVDLGEWAYRGGQWVAIYEVIPANDHEAIAAEVARQLDAFRRLVRREPTHLDSHQHVHREPPARSVLVETAARLGVPLRHFHARIRYCGDFYGQTGEGDVLPDAVTAKRLMEILAALPRGTTELACHPGDAAGLDTMYRDQRQEERIALCDPQVRAIIDALEIRLCSFADVAAGITP